MIFWTVRQASRHELSEDQPHRTAGVIYQKCYKNARQSASITPGGAIPYQQNRVIKHRPLPVS